ncbi:hypothetical protein NQ317_005002 [Molorchus minor]|uniref:Thioredoxin domain-containing protein n=1 Tax=Molorchus minor TaxID=1323400 RepID=A0ABQ9K410_9CUCU|nr:hypothetical protein NQ317_005002 [Molorchus minor]
MVFLRCALLILPLFSTVFSHEDEIHTVKYTNDNFSEEVAKKSHFVMFYAPWCGHCQRLAPTWEQLAEMVNEDDSNIRIAKVDCTTDSKVCSDHDGEEELGGTDVPQPMSGLIELTEDTFDGHVASGKHFIKFYAPWCGHCQKLAPTWEELSKSLEFDKGVSIGKVDCTQHRSVCNNFDIKGYPTLLWIEDGKKVDKYLGDRSQEALKNYVHKMRGANKDDKEKSDHDEDIPSPLNELTGDTFEGGIQTGLTFIKFYAPWCGHCKRLAPTWENLSKKFLSNQMVSIVKVDCTLEANKQLCNDEDIEGFPTLFLYRDGKKISEYSGSRSLEDLYDFVNKFLGHDEL